MKSNIKYKPTTWTLLVSSLLDQQTRKHIARTKYDSLAQFVRTAVSNLLEQELPEPEGDTKPVFWILCVPPSLDKRMRSMAKTKYPSMSDLIRDAVRKQLERERRENAE